MTDMSDIDALAEALHEARDDLREIVASAEEEIAEIRRNYAPSIKAAAEKTAQATAALYRAVHDNPDLFRRPKTTVLYGIRVGWRKRKGTLAIHDAEATVRLIERHLPDRTDALLKVTKRPVKSALNGLSVAELKRIGVEITRDIDEPVVEPTDSEIDKLVEALLASALMDEEEIDA